MIFRNSKGQLIELNILDFISDKEYYKKLISIKFFSKDNI